MIEERIEVSHMIGYPVLDVGLSRLAEPRRESLFGADFASAGRERSVIPTEFVALIRPCTFPGIQGLGAPCRVARRYGSPRR
jgi:hypothetical protein